MSYKKLLLTGVIFLFSVSCFYSCVKNESYKAVVTVSKLEERGDSHVKIPVANARLIFGVDTFHHEVYREAYTDATGKYEGEWDREVSLEVQASADIDGVMYVGKSRVNLSLGGIDQREILLTEEQ